MTEWVISFVLAILTSTIILMGMFAVAYIEEAQRESAAAAKDMGRTSSCGILFGCKLVERSKP